MSDAKVQVEGQWLDHITDKAKATLRDLKNEFSLTSVAERALGNITADAIKDVIRGAAEKAEQLTKIYIGQEASETRLRFALEKSGQAFGDNFEKLTAYADVKEKVTRFDDENIKSAEALALTLGKARAEQVIPMTDAAADLATVLGTDVSDAMRLMIKGGQGMTEALSRVGIQFTSTGDQGQDMAAIMKLVQEQMGGAAEKGIGPVERKLREIEKAIEDNDKSLGKNVSNWTIWAAGVKLALSNVWTDIQKNNESLNNSPLFRDTAPGYRGPSGAPSKSGVQGPWGLSGTPSWALPPAGINTAFIGPAAPPGGSASAQSSFVSDSEERARKLQAEIDLYGKLAIAKRDALGEDAYRSDLSRLSDDARRMGGMPDLAIPGRSAYGSNANWNDYFKTNDEAEKERRAFEQAHERAVSVASTLVSGLRMVEQQGKITFESIARVLERMLIEIGMQQLEKGLTDVLSKAFTAGDTARV